MKRAPLTFLAALAIFLATIAGSKRVQLLDVHVPLDFSGVDTLVVRGESNGVTITTELPTEAHYGEFKHRKVSVYRHGSEMVIETDGNEYGGLGLTAPPGIRVIVIDGGSVQAKTKLESLEIRTSGGISWSGNIGSLRVIDAHGNSECKEDYCRHHINIGDGEIGALYVASLAGNVDLAEPDRITSATLALGPKATYALKNARRLANLRLVEFAADDGSDTQKDLDKRKEIAR